MQGVVVASDHPCQDDDSVANKAVVEVRGKPRAGRRVGSLRSIPTICPTTPDAERHGAGQADTKGATMQNGIVTRRAFVTASAAALVGTALVGCTPGSPDAQEPSEGPSHAEAPEPSATEGGSTGGTVLVACFSATGNTRAVAKELAGHLGADYVEIEPAEPYTKEDLDYSDETTRATAEQHDPASRPALAAFPDFSAYGAVLLGHPIWWGKAPRLICTLLEGADLSGRKVAEFCTSGGSGIEGAAGELEELTPGAAWIGAKRFAAGAAEAEAAEWADSLGIR